jgi:hypothetical protein
MAEVATLSSQQSTTGGILAPAVGTRTTVTSISQAQALIADRQRRIAQLDAEWDAENTKARNLDLIIQTTSSESLRAASKTSQARFEANADVIVREIFKLQDELAFFQSEFERLRLATGLPGTPGPPPAAPTGQTAAQRAQAEITARLAAAKAAAQVAAAKAAAGIPTGLPFGLTRNQAFAFVGVPLLILVVSNLWSSS